MYQLKTLCACALIAASTVDATAADPVETRAFYSTNPDNAVGRAASITIDGNLSDWTDDMIIATCGANDIATAFKGSHENCVLDLYAVYAAWDDANLYIAWQMCNTGDTWARPGDGPLTDYGRVGDVPLVVALSVDPSSTAMSGMLSDGRFIWGHNAANGVKFASHADHLFFMSGKAGSGEPAMFTAVNAAGDTDYASGCTTFRSCGITYKMAEGFAPSHLWRQNTTAEWATPTELISDPSVLDNIYDPECYDNLKAGIPEGLKPHDYAYDSFYEMQIPLSVLGINCQWLEANGIGCRVVATRGESGIDCCPFDPSMVDNTFGEYGKDNSTTHEKDDIDIITYATASIGKIRTGEVDPLPDPRPDPEPDPTPDPEPADGNYTVYFDNSTSGWSVVKTWIWDEADANRNYTGGQWPGADMYVDSATGYHRYSFECTATAPKLKCIFNPGGDNGKTGDLDLVNNGLYNASGFVKVLQSGIQDIDADADIRPEYFTLQGVRVDNPDAPGVYIKREGTSTSKIFVK